MHNKLILVLVPFVVSDCVAIVSNHTNAYFQKALETADAQTVCDLLANGGDCNARFGEKKRTGLMISVDHLAGELLELEEKIVEKTSYMDVLGGACIAGGIALLALWLLSPTKQVAVPAPVPDAQSPVPVSPQSDSPQRPTHRRAQSGSSLFQISVTSPTPPSENNGNKDEKYPTPNDPVQHLSLTPPPPTTRIPKGARVIPEQIRETVEENLRQTSPRAKRVQVPSNLVKAAPANVPPKKKGLAAWLKRTLRIESCNPSTPPDSPPHQAPVQTHPVAVAPQFSLPVGGTAIVAGAAAITSHNTAITKFKRRVQDRVRIIRALMEAEQIDCHAQDTDGKTVVDIMNGCKGCKMGKLRTIWEEVRSVILQTT